MIHKGRENGCPKLPVSAIVSIWIELTNHVTDFTDPSATSVKMVSDSKPKVYAYPCAQYNNLKKTIER